MMCSLFHRQCTCLDFPKSSHPDRFRRRLVLYIWRSCRDILHRCLTACRMLKDTMMLLILSMFGSLRRTQNILHLNSCRIHRCRTYSPLHCCTEHNPWCTAYKSGLPIRDRIHRCMICMMLCCLGRSNNGNSKVGMHQPGLDTRRIGDMLLGLSQRVRQPEE